MFDPSPPTYPQYDDLRVAAERAAHQPVDPAKLGRADAVRRRRGDAWCATVIGRPFPGERHASALHTELIVAADAADIDPPLPQWLTVQRAQDAGRQAAVTARREAVLQHDIHTWTAARQQCPLAVQVRLNLRARPRHGHLHNLGHVVPLVDALSGGHREHSAGRALCETTRRARPLQLGEPTDAPATCVRCLTYTPKIKLDLAGAVRLLAALVTARYPSAATITYSCSESLDDVVLWTVHTAADRALFDSNTAVERTWPALAAATDALTTVVRTRPERGDGLVYAIDGSQVLRANHE